MNKIKKHIDDFDTFNNKLNEGIFSKSNIKDKNFIFTKNTINNVLDSIINDNIKLNERILYLYNFYFDGDDKEYNIRTGVNTVKIFFNNDEIKNKLKNVYNKLLILQSPYISYIEEIINDIN